MPLKEYQADDPFDNHPLFKTEEQARLEETMDAVEAPQIDSTMLAWPGEKTQEETPQLEESLWTNRSRDFDWGD
jgi:hypothetical protein